MFHWNLAKFDILIMSETEDEARKQLIDHFLHADWQNPPRMNKVLLGLSQAPLFAAETNHPVVIDNK